MTTKVTTRVSKQSTAKSVTGKPIPAGALQPARVSESDIRFRAYLIYRARVSQGLPGDAVSDWLQAEHELSERAWRARPSVLLRP